MGEPTLVFASHLSSYHALLPASLTGDFLRKLLEHPRGKVWFAFVVAVAAASLLFNHLLPLVSPKIKAASIPKGPTGLPIL
ncbi:hypothetical protein PMIN03_013069, partial [Paraphaeosphaeria minitans]